jgi:hypothetical protein
MTTLKLNISDADRTVLLQNLDRMYGLLTEGGESGRQVLADYKRLMQLVEAKKDLDSTSVGLLLQTLKHEVDPSRAHRDAPAHRGRRQAGRPGDVQEVPHALLGPRLGRFSAERSLPADAIGSTDVRNTMQIFYREP